VLKALEKNPADRCATAGQLADDLRRYLEDKPIQAKPPTWRQRLVKWGRRHQAVVWGAVATLVLTVFLLAASTAIIWREKGKTQQALDDRTVALDDRTRALDDRTLALYYAHVSLAAHEMAAGEPEQAEAYLDACPVELRQWEWHYLKRRCGAGRTKLGGIEGRIENVAFSPEPGVTRIAAVSLHECKVWDWRTRKEVIASQRITSPIGIPYREVAFSPDGQYLVLASTGKALGKPMEVVAIVQDARTGQKLHVFCYPGTILKGLAFSPDGRLLALAAMDGLRLLDAHTWKTLLSPKKNSYSVTSVAFSPDSKRVVVGLGDGTAKVLDARRGRELLTFTGQPT
jgi:WD40 repeat protein